MAKALAFAGSEELLLNYETFSVAKTMKPLGQDVSDTIRLARIMSIFFTAYVHAWPGAAQVKIDAAAAGMDWIAVVFIDWLGRGAVPLLSVVSGILVWRTLSTRLPRQFLAGKLRTLIVPMVIWNTFMAALLLASLAFGLTDRILSIAWYNWIFALNAVPVNVPLGFLRDMFVCMLFMPVLYPALLRTPLAGIGLLVAVAVTGYATYKTGWPLFLRPDIFVMFALGLVIMRWDLLAMFSRPALGVAALVGLVLVDLVVPGAGMLGPDLFNLIRRMLIALLVWQVCFMAIRHAGGRRLLWLERYIFFFFCSHAILFAVLGKVSEAVLTNPFGVLYWVYFVLQPVLGLMLAAGLYEIAQNYARQFLAVSTGRRAVGQRPEPVG